MQKSSQEMYDELSLYTLAHKDSSFIHQNIVDAYAAQTADENTKPIKVAFALMGLFLYLEKNYTGKEVQLAHMKMAKEKKVWPTFTLPRDRGEVTVVDALNAEPGETRDAVIRKWCESVWEAWSQSQQSVRDWVTSELRI
jgi:hypothetical protein